MTHFRLLASLQRRSEDRRHHEWDQWGHSFRNSSKRHQYMFHRTHSYPKSTTSAPNSMPDVLRIRNRNTGHRAKGKLYSRRHRRWSSLPDESWLGVFLLMNILLFDTRDDKRSRTHENTTHQINKTNRGRRRYSYVLSLTVGSHLWTRASPGLPGRKLSDFHRIRTRAHTTTTTTFHTTQRHRAANRKIGKIQRKYIFLNVETLQSSHADRLWAIGIPTSRQAAAWAIGRAALRG